MSYDLCFWRQSGLETSLPADIHATLCAGESHPGLDELPVAAMLQALATQLGPDWKQSDPSCWQSRHGKPRIFELAHSSQHFLFCCKGLTGDDMNRLIDWAWEFDCRLFDPQIGERYA